MSLVGMRLGEPNPLRDAFCPSQARCVALSRHREIISQKNGHYGGCTTGDDRQHGRLSPSGTLRSKPALHDNALAVELLLDVDHTFAQIGFGFDLAFDFFDGIHHGGVIASAQHFADLG